LFEAALEDQELFKALQTEDALKELLDDPVTRGQLRAALQPRPRAFPWRRWLLGVAAPATIAFVVVIFMNRANAPRLVAMKQPAPEIVAPAPAKALQAPLPAPPPEADTVAKKGPAKMAARSVAKTQPVVPAPAPVPAPAAVARLEPRPLAAPAIANFSAARLRVVPDAVRQQLSTGLASNAPLYQGPLLRYKLIRGGPAGDAIQVEVTPATTGYLALYQADPGGKFKRVYPPGEEAARVLLNVPMQIPMNPLPISGMSRLRLVFVPAPMPANGVFAGAETSIGTGAAPVAPLVLDIPVAR
jgi:hypothetical protein